MLHQFFLQTILLISLLLVNVVQANVHQQSKANIVIIMVDDLGFSDLKSYGGELSTPTIDELANQGVKFSNFYNAARCVPSRAALLTGLYPHQAGLGHMVSDLGEEAYRGELSKHAVTLAEVLSEQGYFTAMTGKWHLTKNWHPDDVKDNWPLQRGFQRFYGTLPGHGSLYDPFGLVDGNTPTKLVKGSYYTDIIGKKSVEYINEAVAQDKPFFLYMSHVAPHYPLHAKPAMVAKQKGKFSAGWDTLRKNRHDKLLKLGLLSQGTKLSPRDEQVPAWQKEPNQAWQQHRMEVYAAMMAHVDQSIQSVIAVLKDKKQLDNTYIFFLSDNGASPEGHLNNTVERLGTSWNSAVIPKTTPQGKEVTSGDWINQAIGGADTYGSYGIKWANLSNTPFRNHKTWLHEGGITAPLIVVGPNIVAKSLSHQAVHLIDFMPTILNFAQASYPKNYQGEAIEPLSGIDFSSVLIQQKTLPERSLFWEHEGNRAIRKGDWKLVSEYPGTWSSVRAYPTKGQWELYNMANDRTELTNLAKAHPDKVAAMSKAWQQWANSVGVVDWTKLMVLDKID
jgi:arylsulfatase